MKNIKSRLFESVNSIECEVSDCGYTDYGNGHGYDQTINISDNAIAVEISKDLNFIRFYDKEDIYYVGGRWRNLRKGEMEYIRENNSYLLRLR